MDKPAALLGKIKEFEDELKEGLNTRRGALHLRVHNGKIAFERAVVQRHRELKVHLLKYILGARPLILITSPLIYGVVVPFVLLDIAVSVYQAVCFPIYGIDKVKRADYFVFDRAQLGYLNGLEKLNCAYCSYGNGLIAYVREIAARTEQYWCPIKHAKQLKAAHTHYRNFVEFGDAEGYREHLEPLRTELRNTVGDDLPQCKEQTDKPKGAT